MSDPSETIPLIDLTGLADDAPGALARVAAEIGRAARGIGFFYVAHHGVPADLIARVFETSAGFFALPEAEKRRISIDKIGNNRGYVPMKAEALDPTRPGDLKEAFNMGFDLPPDHPELHDGTPFRGLNGWPDMVGFRDTMLAYFDACQALGARLHRAIAVDLGLDPEFFDAKIDRPMSTLRLLHYPAQPAKVDAGQMGAGAHTDYGNLTLLMTDSVGGLEVRARDGRWLPAPVIPGAFVVNIGDCLMRWTNDVYVSDPHRVVSPEGRERYSVAFFLDPNPEAMVEAIPSCVPAGEAPKYPPITAAGHLKDKLDATYAFRRTGTGT